MRARRISRLLVCCAGHLSLTILSASLYFATGAAWAQLLMIICLAPVYLGLDAAAAHLSLPFSALMGLTALVANSSFVSVIAYFTLDTWAFHRSSDR